MRSGGRPFPACNAGGCDGTGVVGGTTQRRETQWLRRVCAGDLNEVDHDCAFGGVTSWAAFPGISLSHLLVEPLPGEVGLWVSDGGGVEGSGPGLMKLLLLAREDSVQV